MKKDEYIKEYIYDTYKLTVFSMEKKFPILDDNLDVSIDYYGKKYCFTFFTLLNIKSLFKKFKENGECKNGLYFNCKDMIILEEISIENIKNTIDGLIDEYEIENYSCEGR